MRRRVASLTAAAFTLALLVPAGSVSAASTISVHPGQSIQAAINKAPAGGLVVVERGTYRGNLEIKRSLRLVGHNAVIVPAAKPTPNICLTPGFFNGVPGICIHGVPNADVTAIAPISNVSVEGITVQNFSGPGIVALGVAGFRVVRVVTAHNGEMGMFINMVSSLSLLSSSSYDNHGDGLFLENLPESSSSANAVITGNTLYGNLGSGIMFINSLGGRIALNTMTGNCAGISVVGFAGQYGSAGGDVSIQLNQVTANNRMCPPDGSGTPAYGGVGIALLGSQNTVVALNDVEGNVAQAGSAFPGGGIAIATLGATSASPASLAPTGNSVRLNRLSGNTPNDIYGDGTGTGNTAGGNSCTPTNLTGAC